MIDLDSILVPVEGEPGTRAHPETGERFYSAHWLGDAADAAFGRPLLRALVPVEPPTPAVGDVPAAEEHEQPVDVEETERRQRLAVVSAQLATLPRDRDLSPTAAAARSRPLLASGRPAPMAALIRDGVVPGPNDARRAARQTVIDAARSTLRAIERLAALAPSDERPEILKERRPVAAVVEHFEQTQQEEA